VSAWWPGSVPQALGIVLFGIGAGRAGNQISPRGLPLVLCCDGPDCELSHRLRATIMNTKLHIDNLSASTAENDLRDWFSPYGNVVEVNIPTNRTSGRSRGFGFVTMATPEGALSAIQALNGKTLGSSTLTVSEAWPHEQRAT